MLMTNKIDYSTIRYHLTNAIRYLQILYQKGLIHNIPDSYLNEYDYWISSLDLARTCLYGCTDSYDGQINVFYAIEEIKSEMTNFIKVVKKVKHIELKYLDKAYHSLDLIEE